MAENQTRESGIGHAVTVNQELVFPFPDGFHVMNPEERQNLRMFGEDAADCLADPERHMVICIGYKQPPGWALLMLSAKDLAKKAEAQLRKPMEQYGYRLTGFSERNLGGGKAHGFSFEYTAQGIEMYADSFVLKKGKTVYYFHCYARKAQQAESAAVWQEMTEHISFSG